MIAHRPPLMRRLLISCVAMLLGAAALQPPAAGAQTPVLVGGEQVTARVQAAAVTAPEAAAYERVVAESIGVILERSGFLVAGDPAADEAWLSFDYAILSLIPRLHISVSVRDLQTGSVVSAVSGRARANVTLFNSLDDIVSRSVADATAYLALRENFEPEIRPTPIAGVLRRPEGRVEGEQVRLQPAAALEGDSAEGILLADGVSLPVSVRRPGHYPAEGTTGVDAVLPEPEPYRRLGVQLHSSLGRLAGAGIAGRYALVPDRLTAALELDGFTSGLQEDAPYRLLHLETRALAEFTIYRWRWFSLRVSSGPGLVVTSFLSGVVAPYTDFFWNVANIMPVVQTGRQYWFARFGSSYYFETDRGFFPAGVDELPQLFVGTYRRF